MVELLELYNRRFESLNQNAPELGFCEEVGAKKRSSGDDFSGLVWTKSARPRRRRSLCYRVTIKYSSMENLWFHRRSFAIMRHAGRDQSKHQTEVQQDRWSLFFFLRGHFQGENLRFYLSFIQDVHFSSRLWYRWVSKCFKLVLFWKETVRNDAHPR